MAPPADEPWRTISPRGRALRMPATVLSLARCHGPSHRARAALTPPYLSGRTAAVEGLVWPAGAGETEPSAVIRRSRGSMYRRTDGEPQTFVPSAMVSNPVEAPARFFAGIVDGAAVRASEFQQCFLWACRRRSLTSPGRWMRVLQFQAISSRPQLRRRLRNPSPSLHLSTIPGTCLPRLAAKHHHHKATPPLPQGERHQYGAVAVNTTTTNVALASIHPTPSLGLFLLPARCSFGLQPLARPRGPLKLKFIKLVRNQTSAMQVLERLGSLGGCIWAARIRRGGLFVILAVVGGVFSETVGWLHFALSALVTDLACQFVSFRCCW